MLPPARAQWARSAARLLVGVALLALVLVPQLERIDPQGDSYIEVLQNVQQARERRLAHKAKLVPDLGTQALLRGRTVRAAVIASDTKSLQATHPALLHLHETANVSAVAVALGSLLEQRSHNLQQLEVAMKLAEVPLLRWPYIRSKPCPHFLHGHMNTGSNNGNTGHHTERSERGLGLSHLQVWMEFVFFDNDVVDAMHRPTPEYITSNWYSSSSGSFTAHANQSLSRDGIPFLEDDVLLVLEDGVQLSKLASGGSNRDSGTSGNSVGSGGSGDSSSDVSGAEGNGTDSQSLRVALSAQLAAMQTDLLLLVHTGHAPPHAPPPPSSGPLASRHGENSDMNPGTVGTGGNSGNALPTAAYALTRAAARRLWREYDICGLPLGEQLRRMANRGVLSCSSVDASEALFTLSE
ncbi:hypothetical protein B484DRAFT_448371 [Ochromonadaceae sp. CCMP2298]|nr:hypothetical protein B484DRAFT_448371 [Ochromonadaceae sp. CCMP2298]